MSALMSVYFYQSEINTYPNNMYLIIRVLYIPMYDNINYLSTDFFDHILLINPSSMS